jgi:hypothetical protein
MVFQSAQCEGVQRNFSTVFARQTSTDVSIHNFMARDSILLMKGPLQSLQCVHSNNESWFEKVVISVATWWFKVKGHQGRKL